jgi:hypothetical protein
LRRAFRQPVFRKKTFSRRIGHQVQASSRVKESTMLESKMGQKSPATATGRFSTDFPR